MSSSKRFLPTYPIITNGDMTTALTSLVTNINYLDNLSVQLQWTGSPTGTFNVQGSLDYQLDTNTNTVQNPGTWTSLTLNPTPVAAGTSGNILINMAELAFPFIRVTYTGTGAGTLNAFISGKAI